MNHKLNNESVENLFRAILTLESVEECYRFFEDLCTVPELLAMSQRMHVARLINEERVYSQIVEETGASTATISRVKRTVEGDTRGYEIAFSRMGLPLKKQDGGRGTGRGRKKREQ